MKTEKENGTLWQRWSPLLLMLGGLFVLLVALPDIFLLLLIAVFIVYLIEPIVGRLTRIDFRKRRLPRWGAVITIYSLLIGIVLGTLTIVVPVLVREIAVFGEELPAWAREFQESRLPVWNERLTAVRGVLTPRTVASAPFDAARAQVNFAVQEAQQDAELFLSLDRAARERLLRMESGWERTWYPGGRGAGAGLEIVPNKRGGFDVRLPAAGLNVQYTGEQTWRLVSATNAGSPRNQHFDIGTALTDSLREVFDAPGQQISEVVQLGQRFLIGLLSAVMSILVTFMVAAFVSIDAPAIVGFLIGLFPRDRQSTALTLLRQLDRGLSGVIRGQLSICLINGLLTGIGLALFNVKFAFLLAIIAGVFSLVPIFGTILSTIPCVLFALPQGVATALLVLGWIIVIHLIEANVLHPKIMGTTARIHPAIVIIALIVGERIYGPMGALIAVPTASVLQTLFFFMRDQMLGEEQESAPSIAPESAPESAAPEGEEAQASGHV